MIKKVLIPLFFRLSDNENLTITFQSLLKLSYPFKIEGLFLVLKYSFTASITPPLLSFGVPRRCNFRSVNR